MDKLRFLDPTGYIIKGNLRLKNLILEDYKITEMYSKKIELRMSTFQNVIFENHFEDNYIVIKKCTFINCAFGDIFGNNSNLEMQDCMFRDCLFENIRMDIKGEVSTVLGCTFINCDFKNMDLKADLEISYININEGVMENIYCLANEISDSNFSKIMLRTVDLQLAIYKNKFKSVIFENVISRGNMKLEEKNEFLQCDTSGVTLLEGI